MSTVRTSGSRPFWNISDWHPGEGGHGSDGRGRSRGGELHRIVQWLSVNGEKLLKLHNFKII